MKSISKIGLSQGNKSRNLEVLQRLDNKNFVVPQFFHCTSRDQLHTLSGCDTVAVRSDSSYEDSDQNSGAGMFDTILNVPNDIHAICDAYDKIQSQAHSKVNKNIGVIVQEMVNDPECAGVVFSRDVRTDNGDYFTVNYASGLGNTVVDGMDKTKTVLIHKDYSLLGSDPLFFKPLVDAINQIISAYNDRDLDIEFAYKDSVIYILQTRPLTAVSSLSTYVASDIRRKIIEDVLNQYGDTFLGDMVDVNVAELLGGSRSLFINSFFSYIFPENALSDGRAELGYKEENGASALVGGKMYMDVRKNVRSFLPNTLTEDQVELFQNYFATLLVKNPSYQNQLDTIYYPISNQHVVKIVETFPIDDFARRDVIAKFELFFLQLEDKLALMADTYLDVEHTILNSFFLGSNNIADAHKFVPSDLSILEITDIILELATYFVKYVRGAFYFRGQEIGDGYFYKYRRYSNQLELLSHEKKSPIEVLLTQGFDLLTIQHNAFEFNKHTQLSYDDQYVPTNREIFETARENIKYLMMLYITELAKKIQSVPLDDIDSFSFKDLLNCLDGSQNISDAVRLVNMDIYNNFIMPDYICRYNHLGLVSLGLNQGIYFPFGTDSLDGDLIFMDNIHQFDYREVQDITNGKIVLFVNATPEIDSYLPYMVNAKAIVTKFGGPGAHIVLKIREMNVYSSNKIGLIVGLGDAFDELVNKKNIFIDFTKEVIQGTI